VLTTINLTVAPETGQPNNSSWNIVPETSYIPSVAVNACSALPQVVTFCFTPNTFITSFVFPILYIKFASGESGVENVLIKSGIPSCFGM
jgi:hypothetical protein